MNEPVSSAGKRIVGIGHAFFIFFIGMAAVTFREREFVADNALHVFTILRKSDFAVFQERYSIMLNQLLPVLGVKFSAPLNTVLVLHTISIPLFCYGCFILAAHALKNYRTALGIVLGSCIMVTQSFYFLFEMNQAVSLLLLLHGFMMNRETFRLYHWALLLTGLVLAFFLHPLVLIGFLYLSGYTVLQQEVKDIWQKNKSLLLIVGAGLLIVAVRTVFFANAYEQGKTPGISSLHLLLKVNRFEVTAYFLKWLVRDYYLLLVFSACITIHYFRAKKWLRLGWYWACLVGFILLVLSVQKDSDESIRYHLELHYQILALIAVVPFVYEIWPQLEKKRWVWAGLILLLLSRFATFYAHRTVFADRLHWYDKLYTYTNRFSETKFIINEANVPGLKAQNQLVWAGAYESLLYFASTGRQPLKTIFISGDNSALGYLAADPTKFVSTFESFPAADLPASYFHLQPSVYRFLNTEPANNAGPEAFFILPKLKTIQGRPGSVVRIPVQVNASFLPSGLNLNNAKPYLLSYRLYAGNREQAAHIFRIPLEVDIEGAYEQDLVVEVPETAGTYQVVPVLLPRDLSSWKTSREVELIVK
jgi:hypothetical protein